MAGRATYDDETKARIYVALSANDGNVKRTARDTGVPESTIRHFRKEWEKNGPPKQELVEAAVGDFIEVADRIRVKALDWIEEMIDSRDSKVKMNDLNNVMGTLTDKIDRVRDPNHGKHEVKISLPSAEEIALAGQMLAQGALAAAKQRQEELADAELREQPALPARTL